jgi:hypothetical protein
MCSASCPGRFIPGEIASGTHSIWDWAGPRVGLDVVMRKILPNNFRINSEWEQVRETNPSRYKKYFWGRMKVWWTPKRWGRHVKKFGSRWLKPSMRPIIWSCIKTRDNLQFGCWPTGFPTQTKALCIGYLAMCYCVYFCHFITLGSCLINLSTNEVTMSLHDEQILKMTVIILLKNRNPSRRIKKSLYLNSIWVFKGVCLLWFLLRYCQHLDQWFSTFYASRTPWKCVCNWRTPNYSYSITMEI